MSNEQASISLPVRPGDIIGGKYRIDRAVGKGGMGVVASAVHMELDERVAIKFLSAEHSTDSDYCKRFLREARLAVKIKSPHVVRVLDVGALETGLPYIVMELLTGEDVHALRRRKGALPVAEAVEYVVQACAAAAAAHSLGIIHRDLKPSNLFVTEDANGEQVVKVLDFGISKLVSDEDPITKLTSPNTVLGSLSYMSPEQIRSMSDVDARTDVWSLGVILYELLAGKRPFRSREPAAIVGIICSEPPAPLRETCPGVPEALERAILGCLEKDLDRRTRSAADFAAALAPFRPEGARPFQIPPPRDSMSGKIMVSGRPSPTPRPPEPPPAERPTGPQDSVGTIESKPPVETQASTPTVSITVSRRALRLGVFGAAASVILGMTVAVVASRSGPRPTDGALSSAALAEAMMPIVSPPRPAATDVAAAPTERPSAGRSAVAEVPSAAHKAPGPPPAGHPGTSATPSRTAPTPSSAPVTGDAPAGDAPRNGAPQDAAPTEAASQTAAPPSGAPPNAALPAEPPQNGSPPPAPPAEDAIKQMTRK